MLRQGTLDFLIRLKSNNSTEWARKHRDEMNDAKRDIVDFASKIVREISIFDGSIAKNQPDPEKCVTRLNRDMRFGSKTGPYKSDFYVVVGVQGIQGVAASYAVHIEPGNCFVGGGAPNPKGADLLNYRKKISEDFDEFKSIVSCRSFVKQFPNGIQSQSGKSLQRGPRHFDQDDPAIEYLKKDGFITREFVPDRNLTTADGIKEIVDLLRGSKPLIDFLNEIL
jgi:uncharacterized protein (TIGR02453 family)